MKKVIAIGLCVFLLATCAISNAEEQNIIEDIIVYYGSYGEAADETVTGLLEQLDEDSASKWKSILNYWKFANNDIEIHYDVLPDGLPETDELCMVVLGFQLNEDGSMKEELVERLKVVLASAKKYPNAYIACTGGGTAKNDSLSTEAGRMTEWLVENGIDRERIILENHSLTTAQNAIFTSRILGEQYPQVKQLAIISSDYHIATGALLFEAESILKQMDMTVVSNAAWKAPSGVLSTMFQAGALIELSGDQETAFEIYYETYDIHELPRKEEKQLSRMADALEATTGYSMAGWDDSHYVYVYESDGIPYRAVTDFSAELCEQLEAIDFFDEDHDARVAEVIGPIPLVLLEDLSQYYPTQEELEAWIGKSGRDLLNSGFEQWGYYFDEETSECDMISGLFEYRVGFHETIKEGSDPEQALYRLTVKNIEITGVSNRATDWPLYYGESEYDDHTAEWIFPESPEMTEEVMAVFNHAKEELGGGDYEPIAFLGESEGIYCVFCRVTGVYDGAKPYYTLVYVSENGVQNIWDIWMEKHVK
ncbi:MAG: YdcF family protein [Oscillospiraceae bacterium]|nr:YdcF family protein [Oscillospiraceae bacterium]